MIDWDSLIGPSTDDKAGAVERKIAGDGTKCPTVSQPKRQVSHPRWDSLNSVTAKLTAEFYPSVPLVPLKKQGRGKQEGKNENETGGAAVEPQGFCAEIGKDQVTTHPAHPAAILLLMAWSRFRQIPSIERADLLLALETMAPADQVRRWHDACVDAGLKPWHVLCLPAPMSGKDCTRCRHLTTRHEAIGKERVQFHWACGLGYLILEHGRGTERLWIAPPECKCFERWYPSEQR